ncbi:MAG: diaminopimelate epimerase [Actinomycetota bacterium]
MRFAKYHGIGNDFVMLADLDERIELTPDLVRKMCDRRFGIGGDGVIRVAPGDGATDLFMDYVNSDGSVGEMCGNGIRCLVVFARAEGLTDADELNIGTRAGPKRVRLLSDGRVEADMGPPIFEPQAIPVAWEGTDALSMKVEIDDEPIEVAALSMGNPHAVLLVEEPDGSPVGTLGPALEHHPAFPNGTNVEFVRVESPTRVRMRVWERGSGETLACGTGACAAAVAARLLGGTEERVTVALPGGELDIRWGGSLTEEAPVLMTGPVVCSFEGEFDLEAYA